MGGVGSAIKQGILEILVHTGTQISLVRNGLLSALYLRLRAAPVTLRVANGRIMMGGIDGAGISLEFVCQKQLSR